MRKENMYYFLFDVFRHLILAQSSSIIKNVDKLLPNYTIQIQAFSFCTISIPYRIYSIRIQHAPRLDPKTCTSVDVISPRPIISDIKLITGTQ